MLTGRQINEVKEIDRFNLLSFWNKKSVKIATMLGPIPIEKKVATKKYMATTWARKWLGVIIWIAIGDMACWKNKTNEKTPNITTVMFELGIIGVIAITGNRIRNTIIAHLRGASL